MATRMLISRVRAQVGMPLTVRRARAGFTQVRFEGVELVEPAEAPGPSEVAPLRISIAKMSVPFSALWGSGVVHLDGPTLQAASVSAVRRLKRNASPRDGGAATNARSARKYPAIAFVHGRVHIGDAESPGLRAESVQGEVYPNDHATVGLSNLEGDVASLIG